jgi:DNA-dependent RNA polymerase auxiliary subunit epsilon
MPLSDFSDFMNDTVTLLKSNGYKIENIKASVQTNKIFIDDPSLPIEEGDRIIRTLPNKLTETYIVVDRGYHEAFEGIEAYYQVKVRKEMNASQPSLPKKNVNYFYGDVVNSQIQQDTQNSQQTQTIYLDEASKAKIDEYLKMLRCNINQVELDDNELSVINEKVNAIEGEIKKQNSNSGLVKEAFSTIRNVLEGVVGSIVASELLYHMPMLIR